MLDCGYCHEQKHKETREILPVPITSFLFSTNQHVSFPGDITWYSISIKICNAITSIPIPGPITQLTLSPKKKLIFNEASKKSDSYLKACEPQHIRGTSHMAQIKTSPRLKRKLC